MRNLKVCQKELFLKQIQTTHLTNYNIFTKITFEVLGFSFLHIIPTKERFGIVTFCEIIYFKQT